MADLVIDNTIEAIVLPNGEELELGTTPTGNIDITQAGVTDVSEYATATVPSATVGVFSSPNYSTVGGARKWSNTIVAYADALGWTDDGEIVSDTYVYDAIASGTSITPTKSTQTIGGVDTMMEAAVTVNPIPSQYIVPSGTKSINANGTGIDVTEYAAVDVAVSGGSPNLQSKTKSYTPSETAQSESVTADTGYDGLDTVDISVGAISSTYVGSGITRRDSTDLSASGATVTAPAGYYAESASKAVASGSAKPAASISASSANKTIGNSTITLSKTVANTPQVTAGYVSSGTQGNTSIELTASMTTKGATTYHPSTTDQSVSATTYLTGAQTFKAVTTSNLTAENIKDGVTVKIGDSTDDDCVTSVTGSYTGETPNLQAKTNINPTTSSQTITADNGYDGLSSVQINAMPSGTAGTPTASKGAVNNHSVSVTPSVTNTAGYISGGTKTGTAVTVSASELVSGTKTISASGNTDVTNYATASVAAGGATASATKGAVSNHSITVTPSVTRTAGYITAGSANGTAVTVSASELVSGSETKTINGTYDVTNLAEIVVDVQGGGGGGMTVATETTTLSTASSSIQFTGLSGQPTSFVVTTASDLATGASPYKTAAVVFDGTDLHGQIVTNTSNANASYSTSFTQSYSSGTLTITGSGTNFQANEYKLIYTYGGTSANIGTAETQVGSGATSITFTGLSDDPDYFSVIFKSNFGTSSGYQRVMSVAYDGVGVYGVAMDSGAKAEASWSYTYNNGSLTVTSTSTSNGGYFHQPGYYQLTYGVGGTVEPTEIEVEPLTVTTNGTYTAPAGKAYSPVMVNVSGGGGSVSVATTTWQNTSTSTVSHQFTGLSGTPKAAFLRCTSQLTRSSSNTYYYIADIVWDGTDTRGNYHLRSNGSYNDVPSTGTAKYNVSVGTNSITFSSTATSRSSAPGSFYNGTYELTYIY